MKTKAKKKMILIAVILFGLYSMIVIIDLLCNLLPLRQYTVERNVTTPTGEIYTIQHDIQAFEEWWVRLFAVGKEIFIGEPEYESNYSGYRFYQRRFDSYKTVIYVLTPDGVLHRCKKHGF